MSILNPTSLLREVPDFLNDRDLALNALDFTWSMAESFVVPTAAGRVLRHLTIPTRIPTLFASTVAVGALFGAFRGTVIGLSEQSNCDDPFDTSKFLRRVGMAAAEGGCNGLSLLGTGLIPYFFRSVCPPGLAAKRALYVGFDLCLNEGLSGATIGLTRNLLAGETYSDNLPTSILTSMGMGIVFRGATHGASAVARHGLGLLLSSPKASIPSGPEGPSLSRLDVFLKEPDFKFPLWLTSASPSSPTHYRHQVVNQGGVAKKIEEWISAQQTKENPSAEALSRAGDELTPLLTRLTDHYQAYTALATEGGTHASLLVHDIGNHLRTDFKKHNGTLTDKLSVLSFVAPNVSINNDKLGHGSGTFILEATTRAFNRRMREAMGWGSDRLSAVTKQGRVNFSLLLNEAEPIKFELNPELSEKPTQLGYYLGNKFKEDVLQELKAIAPHYLRKPNGHYQIKIEEAPDRPESWADLNVHLLDFHVGLATVEDAVASLQTLHPHASDAKWSAIRRQESNSQIPREEDIHALSQHLTVLSLDRAELAREAKQVFATEGQSEAIGRGFIPLGAVLSHDQIIETLQKVLAADLPQEQQRYLTRLAERFLKKNPDTATDAAELIVKLRNDTSPSCDLIQKFTGFLDHSYKSLRAGEYNSVAWFAEQAGVLHLGPHPIEYYAGSNQGLLNYLKRLRQACKSNEPDEVKKLLGEWKNPEARRTETEAIDETYQASLAHLEARMKLAMSDPRNPDNLKPEFWASEALAMIEDLGKELRRARLRKLFHLSDTERLHAFPVRYSAAGDEISAALITLDKAKKQLRLLLMAVEGDGSRDYLRASGGFQRKLHDAFITFHRLLHDTARKLGLHKPSDWNAFAEKIPSTLNAWDKPWREILKKQYTDLVPATRKNDTGARVDWVETIDNKKKHRYATFGASAIGGEFSETYLNFLPFPEPEVDRFMGRLMGALDQVKKMVVKTSDGIEEAARGRTVEILDPRLENLLASHNLQLLGNKSTTVEWRDYTPPASTP